MSNKIQLFKELVTQALNQDPELRRLINLRWEQRYITVRVAYDEQDRTYYPDPNSPCRITLRIIEDPYVGLSLVNNLDPTDCYYVIGLALSKNGLVIDDIEFGGKQEYLEVISKFKRFLQILENAKTYEELLEELEKVQGCYAGHTQEHVECAFTGE